MSIKKCHRYLLITTRRLLDIVAICVLVYSLWLYISPKFQPRFISYAKLERYKYMQKYQTDDNPGRPIGKDRPFLGESDDDFYEREKLSQGNIETLHDDDDEEEDHDDNNMNLPEINIGDSPLQSANVSDAQKMLNYIATNVQVMLHVADGTNLVTTTMINTGSQSILPSTWYIVLCHSQSAMKQKHAHKVANNRLELDQLEGNIFTLRPTQWFKSFDTGERIKFMLGKATAGSDYFPNWYVTAPHLAPRVILSTVRNKLYLDYSGAVEKYFTPLTRFMQNIHTSVQKLDGRQVHVIPTPHSITYKAGKQAVYSVGRWSEWAIMYTSDVIKEAKYLSGQMGNLSFTFDGDRKLIRMTTGQVKTDRKLRDNVREQMYQIYFRQEHQIITIVGVSPVGVFYGIQTLLALISHNGQLITDLPEFNIVDYPRLPYRGLMVDTARSFVRKKEVLRTLDVMAMYKLNVLHFHLSDDQGWRLEIPGLEELTQVGSRRGDDMEEENGLHPYLGAGPHGNTSASGYYSVSDYREILQYADDRFIRVIPEIDTPGHSHAAIVSMRSRSRKFQKLGDTVGAMKYALLDPEDKSVYKAVNDYVLTTINPCMNSTFFFLEHVILAIKEMHKDIQPLTAFHVGGDEVPGLALKRSPLCVLFKQQHPKITTTKHITQYFMMKVSDLLRNMNLSMQIWEDGVFNKDNSLTNTTYRSMQNIQAQIWKTGKRERIINLAKQGYKLILSEASHVYFDHKYEPHPEERGFTWARSHLSLKTIFQYSTVGEMTKLHPQLTKQIIGIEGALWGETIQTRSHFDSMLYPRLLALAERAWHRALWEDTSITDTNPELNKDWNYFSNVVSQKELYRLEKMAIQYYIPPPGVRIRGRTAYVNTGLPGLRVDISVDRGSTWRMFNNGSKIPDGRLYFSTRSTDGTRRSRIVDIMHEAKGGI